MLVRNTSFTVVVVMAATAALSAWTGCHEEQKTTSIDSAAQQYALAPNDGSLGAGDALADVGMNNPDGANMMVLLRQGAAAIAIAEAKVKDGTYEQWYASLNRDPEAIREAKARQAENYAPGTYVDAPIPVPVR